MKGISPYKSAREIYDCWVITYYLQAGIKYNAIPISAFKGPITIKDNGNSMSFNPPHSIDIKGKISNLARITLGTCFIAFDESLNYVFGKRNVTTDNDINSLRAIIYMFRCASAHTPSAPKWCIKPSYKKVFSVKEIDFSMDFKELNDKELKAEQHGGAFELWKLMSYCLQVIEKHSESGNLSPRQVGVDW